MKKSLLTFLIAICLILALPITAYATTYTIDDTDISIQIDDTYWYVFTRDNIENNPELDELEISYDYMKEFFDDNNTYLDAVLYYDDGNYLELFLVKTQVNAGIINLSNYDKEEVLEIAKGVAEEKNMDDYSTYESTYKYMYFEFMDNTYENPFYMYQYVTVVNGEMYTLLFQSTEKFTRWDYNEVEGIVDTVSFDIDPNLKEPESGFDVSMVVKGALIGALVGLVVALVGKGIRKGTSKNKEEIINLETINENVNDEVVKEE